MTQREIQALEISCFVQATEDGGRVRDSIQRTLGVQLAPEEEDLEGYFGNSIINLTWHLTGEQAWTSFQALMSALGKDGRKELMRELDAYLDEHGALYIRLNKQTLVSGIASFSSSDPVRVRVKPRSFMMKGHPGQFYERIMGVPQG
ncbi:MAG: RNA-binding domain-containing protein [Nitrososphaerales archaeon]